MPSARDHPVAWIMLIDDDNPLSLLKLRSLPTPALQSRSLMTRLTIVLTVPTCKSPFPPYLLWHASICSLITLISPAAHSTSPCRQDAATFSFSLAYIHCSLVGIARRPLHIKGDLCHSLSFTSLSVPSLAPLPTQFARSMYVPFLCVFRYVHTLFCARARSICFTVLLLTLATSLPLSPPRALCPLSPLHMLCRDAAHAVLTYPCGSYWPQTHGMQAGRIMRYVRLLSLVPLLLIIYFCSVSNVAIGIDGAMALETRHAILQRHHLPLIRVSLQEFSSIYCDVTPHQHLYLLSPWVGMKK